MAEETETKPPAGEDKSSDSLENPDADANALEGGGEGAQNAEGVVDATSANSSSGDAADKEPPKPKGLKNKLRRFNLYLLLFIFILIVAGVIIAVAYFQSKKASTTSSLKTQNLTEQTLQQVANSDATVGNAQSVLNVESSAVFAGKVLIRDGLEVAGNLQIGGTVILHNITVNGTSSLGQVDVSNNLAVSGDSAIQGSETIGKSLQVNGGGSFGGPITAPQITTSNLQLNSDLVLTHHISVGGGTPNHSQGPALGGGGSATVSGSDTAGTATINTGGGPAAGCFITITFTSKYNQTPRVLITPVGSAAGAIDYYVNRDTGSFSICDATAPPAGASFGFDYFVVD